METDEELINESVNATLKDMIAIAIEDSNPEILRILKTLNIREKCQLWGEVSDSDRIELKKLEQAEKQKNVGHFNFHGSNQSAVRSV